MHWLLVAVILLAAAGPTLARPLTADELDQFVNDPGLKPLLENRDVIAKLMSIKAKTLKPNINLKVPEAQCGVDYSKEIVESIEEMNEKYPDDVHKRREEMEAAGEENYISCFLPTRDEMNCDMKVCEGSEDPAVLCACGPKKCKLDSDGFCDKKKISEDGDKKKDDEEDGSSSLFVFGTMLNLTIFYLISSFF